MKQGIHPDYVECTVKCTCGNTFTTRSTKSELRVDICNACHPFFTGQQKFIDTGGRVQRFADKFGSAKDMVAEREAAKKAKRAAAVAEAEKPMASAREAFNAVAAAADRARDAYSEAKDDAEKRQKKLRGEISEREKEAKAEEHAAQVAQKEADAAQSTLDEANEIHAHPEATASLAHALEADRAERIDRVAEVEELAAAEKTVRERTRGARLKLVLAIASIVLVVVLMLVWTYLAQ